MSKSNKRRKCDHGKTFLYCKICNPSYFCKHGRQKYVCKQCNSGYCDHDKVKSQCIECSPGKFCEHSRRITRCADCGGGSMCKHKRQRSVCDECGKGVPKCKHGVRKRNCSKCGNKCEHGKLKSKNCKECKRGTCKHNKHCCKECNPKRYYGMVLRSRLGKIWSRNRFTKSKKTFDLLGCNMETFKSHIAQQFKEGMTWDNHGHGKGKWQFDHIVPLLHGNPDKVEIERRMHYTNMQPMWASENASKGNRFIG